MEDIISYYMMNRVSQIDPNGKFSELSADFSDLNQSNAKCEENIERYDGVVGQKNKMI